MIEALLNMLPPMRADLAATLTGVNGFTGRGEVEFSSRRTGVRSREVELNGVAGREARLTFDNGRASQMFATDKGDNIPRLYYGANIEIRQNGEAILKGVLKRA